MPDQSKIIENRLLAALMFPSINKLMHKLYGDATISITDEEIKTALMGIKCECKARIEATPDADEEYKHTQEQNLEGLMYWLEEILKHANKHEQEIKANHISTI